LIIGWYYAFFLHNQIGPTSESSDLDVETILKEDIYALVPRRLLASDRDSISLKDLSRMPVLLLSNATALRSILDDAARRCGIIFTPKYECTQTQTLIAMANVELAVCRTFVSKLEQQAGRILVIPIWREARPG
jgi:hypothetical protein